MSEKPTTAVQSVPEIFKYNESQVRTLTHDDGAIWFVARDVCKTLTIPWAGKRTLDVLDKSWWGVVKLATPQENQHKKQGVTPQEVLIINEPAVYKLAFRSNKPEADRFTNWVASEVLPSIRKTGQYTAPVSPETLTPSEQHEISQAVKLKAGENHKAIPEIWGRIKNKFKVAKYSQIPRERFQEVIVYVSEMELRVTLKAEAKQEDQPVLQQSRSEEYYKNRIETIEDRAALYKENYEFYSRMYKDLLSIMIDMVKNRMARS